MPKLVFLLLALPFTGLLLNCSGKTSQDQKANDTLSYNDSVQANSSTSISQNTNQPSGGVLVGSDESVDHSTLDTAYYAILKYSPLPADFFSLHTITNHVVDLDLGESGERFVVHLITRELLEKVETGITFGTMSYRTEYLLHNYLYALEIKDGLTQVLSDYSVGDSRETYSDIGANQEGNYYMVSPVEIKPNQFGISITHRDIVAEESNGQASIYLLKNNNIIQVLNLQYQINSKATGTPDTESYSYVTNNFDNSTFVPLDFINKGLPDLGFKELFEESRGRYGKQTRTQTSRITPCRWNGETYIPRDSIYVLNDW